MKAVTAVLALILWGGPARADTVNVTAFDQGWIQSSGEPWINGNYFTGHGGGQTYRGWWTFSIPSLPGPVTAATLVIPTGTVSIYAEPGTDMSEVVRFGGVAIDPQALLQRSSGVDGYNALGSGAMYGSRAYVANDAGQTLSNPLNSAATADIFLAQGATFAVGSAVTTLSGTNHEEYVFGNTGFGSIVVLQIEYVPAPATLVPFAALALLVRRRR
jgi:hypothetical protein